MEKELILLLDDEHDKGEELRWELKMQGHKCFFVSTIEEARLILKTKKITLCILDVWLGDQETSLVFASEILPILPILFVTQFSTKPNDPIFLESRKLVPHSVYVGRKKNLEWTDEVIRNITFAKEKHAVVVQKNSSIESNPIYKDKLVTIEYLTQNQLFIKKNDILFISSHRKRFSSEPWFKKTMENAREIIEQLKEAEQEEKITNYKLQKIEERLRNLITRGNINHGLQLIDILEFHEALDGITADCCIIYTKQGFIKSGRRIGRIEKQLVLKKWNFQRIHNQYLINLDNLEGIIKDGDKKFGKLSNCKYLIPFK